MPFSIDCRLTYFNYKEIYVVIPTVVTDGDWLIYIGQAMEIGSQALWFLISTWEGHLTPPEVASIADRASRGHEANMERAAAELALSSLPHAHALNPNEIQRAILQCKEQSSEMLERACLAVESAAKGGGVYPEVLFCVARCWHELYEQRMPSGRGRTSRHLPSIEQPPPPIPVLKLFIYLLYHIITHYSIY